MVSPKAVYKDMVEANLPRLDPDRFMPANRRRLSGPALRTFVAISQLWGLTEAERIKVLGFPPRSTYHGWIRAARAHADFTLGADVLMRISAVLGIHQALGVLNSGGSEGVNWLRTPHKATTFGGLPPMELVTNGTQDGLLVVRRFLDAARGGLYMEPNEIDHDFKPYLDTDIVFS